MLLKRRSQEAHEKKNGRRGPVYFLAIVAIILFAVFAVLAFVKYQIAIRENTQKYNELVVLTNEVNERNEQIKAYLEDEDKLNEYIENMARDKLDYANPNEKIYYIIPSGEGNNQSTADSTQ